MMKSLIFASLIASILFPSGFVSAQGIDDLRAPVHYTRESWTIESSLVSDTCGGAANGATFPVTLIYADGELVTLKWFAQEFNMVVDNISPNIFYGEYHNLVAQSHYDLWIAFGGDDYFIGLLTVTFDANPKCSWVIQWDGTLN